MPKYAVTLPVTGVAYVEDVEAENEADAINKAMDICGADHLETWQTHKQITLGNVCYAEVNSASARLEK